MITFAFALNDIKSREMLKNEEFLWYFLIGEFSLSEKAHHRVFGISSR